MKPIIIFVIFVIVLISPTVYAGSDVTLAWDANTEPDLSGYRVFYGTESGDYSQSVDVAKVTEYTVKNLPDGLWYFAVTAYDDSENESGFSNEVFDTFDDQTPPGNPLKLIIKVIVQIGISQE